MGAPATANRQRLLCLAVLGVLGLSLFGATPARAYGPSASVSGPSHADAYVRGSDQAVWHRWQDGAGWHWESLGGTPTSDISAVSWASGRVDVFSRGFGGTLWHRWFNGSWSGWESLGGQLASEPVAVSLSAGTLDVLLQGTDLALWRASYDASGWHWSRLGGRLAAAPAVTSSAAGRIDVFAQGLDLGLWHDTIIGTASSWESLGGRLSAGPSTVSTGAGQMSVFVRGTDGALWYDTFAGGWSWHPAGGQLIGRPTVASTSGAAHAFAEGLDGLLWHWSAGGWESLGGPIAYTVGAASAAVGTLDVFAQSAGNTLWHRAWSGSWGGWENAGGVLQTPGDAITWNVPIYGQDYSLDCETAALEMALASLGHDFTQAYLLSFENPDTRAPVMDANHHVVRWGDPYTNFVGNVNGSDSVPTGYGIYYPVIASIARSHGAAFASGGEGYAASTIYEAVAAGHPVEVWVETGWELPYVGTWTAWDGRPVRYSLAEHTVVLTGVSPTAVQVNDSWRRAIYWVSKSTFERSWADFNDMAIIF